MALNIVVEIVDIDRQVIAEVLEMIAEQVRNGFYKGFDETTKEIEGNNISCNYSYNIKEID